MSFSGDSLPPLREVIRAHGLDARKGLGQHFLLDLNMTRKIARAAGDLSGRDVLEVGPGPGGLTRALLETDARRVVAIERDPRCIEALQPLVEAAAGRLVLQEGDALQSDAGALVAPGAAVVANLPYNVGTPLLFDWLDRHEHLASMTLMFQKEVADRITAVPRTKSYGRLSILCQWLCETRREFDISPRAFTPPPKVTSTVVTLIPRESPLFPADPDILEKVVAAAFNQRRKMLRAALKGIAPDIEERLRTVGIPPTERAEQVSLEGFCALARALDD